MSTETLEVKLYEVLESYNLTLNQATGIVDDIIRYLPNLNPNSEMNNKVNIPFVNNVLNRPFYSSDGAAGFDITAFGVKRVGKTELKEEKILKDGFRLPINKPVLISTRLRVQIPDGYEMQIRPRSGLALFHGISVVNSPGTVDSDYRGEVGVILIQHGNFWDWLFRRGYKLTFNERIAQGVITKVSRANFFKRTHLSSSDRGQGGFGSTGKK